MSEGAPGDGVIRTPTGGCGCCELHAGRAGRGAEGGGAGRVGAAADPGDVRAGGAAAPAARGTGPTWRKAMCSSGCTGSGTGGSLRAWRSRGWRMSSSWHGDAPAAVCEGARARSRAPAGGPSGPHRPGLLSDRTFGTPAELTAGPRRSGGAAQRAVHRVPGRPAARAPDPGRGRCRWPPPRWWGGSRPSAMWSRW